MKESLILALFSILVLNLQAQESNSAYRILQQPTAAHILAVGGENITLDEDDPSIVQHNPALLTNVSSNRLGLSFMSLGERGSWGGAQFVHAFSERHTAAAFAQYRGYGEMTARDEQGQAMGTFSPKDIIAGMGYGYVLSQHWAGGANLKFIHENLGDYSAAAVAVDVGLNYYDEAEDLSLSIVLRNAGAQFKSFNGRLENVPHNLQIGVSKRLQHVPLRFHATLTDLTRWSTTDYVQTDEKKLSTARLVTNHFVLGVDWMPSENLTLSAGYNFRRAYEMTTLGGAHGAGFSLGAGLSFKRVKINLAWSKQHVAASSLMGTLSLAL